MLFIVLGALSVAAFLTTKQQSVTSTLGQDRLFAIKETDKIGKIFIADREGHKTNLVRKGKDWEYNYQHKANPNAINNLLDAISRVQMKFKPADAAVKGMVTDLATRGIKVEIYDQSGKKMKAYYVGGSTPDERGTYMIMEGSNQPYVTSIPNWEGNIRFRYSLKNDDWRDKTIFEASVDEVARIVIEYPKQKDQSFELTRNGNTYQVVPFFDITPKMNTLPSRASVERFLSGFKKISAESFETNNPRKDSVLQTIPFCNILLKKTNGEVQSVQLYPILKQYGTVETPVVERYFALSKGEDFMLVQNRLFKPILWGYPFFFENQQ